MKKCLLLIITLFIGLVFLPSCNENKKDDSFKVNVKEFNKHGNVILDITFDALKEKNIEPMDLINVTIAKDTYIIPVGTSYSDVDSGSMICRFDLEDEKVILAINGGNFAEGAKMAVKETISEDPGYQWNVSVKRVYISLNEKYGYKDQYVIRHLERTNVREDYSTLNDAEFANCRAVTASSIKANTLFRGTTPLDDSMGRNTYAMNFLSENKIKTIINLTDTLEEMKAYGTYTDSYYSTCKVANIVTNYEFTESSFASKVKECVEFIIANDGPYYIHCKEGKDRTGILCAILECYLGASLEEVINDYMLTYENFYQVEKDSETYNIILKTNIEKTLCGIFNTEKLENLETYAEAYLLSIGLTESDLFILSFKLGDYTIKY